MTDDTLDKNFTYHKPNDDQVTRIVEIRHDAKTLAETIQFMCPESREKSLAITKLEEAMMWANASIVRED